MVVIMSTKKENYVYLKIEVIEVVGPFPYNKVLKLSDLFYFIQE